MLSSHQHKPFPLLVDAAGLEINARAYPPTRYRGNAVATPTFFVDRAGIDGLCGKELLACAVVGGGGMVLPDPCDPRFAGEEFAFTACHEKGHNRGWPADHGD